jgi:hypothetical protein
MGVRKSLTGAQSNEMTHITKILLEWLHCGHKQHQYAYLIPLTGFQNVSSSNTDMHKWCYKFWTNSAAF